MAWQIVKHAFAMVFNNFGQALRVSVIPALAMALAWVVVMSVSGIPLSALDGNPSPEQFEGAGIMAVLLLVAALVFTMFVAGWVAVAWHRFILLEEYSGYVPAIADRPIWGYVGKSLLLGLVLTLAAIPIGMVIGMVLIPFSSATGPSTFGIVLASVLIGTIIGYLWFRTAISLPAKAIGTDMSFRDAWAKSASMSNTIIGVTLIIVVLNIGVSLLFGAVASGVPLLSLVFEVGVNWLSTMVGISVLTTLYGHLVEGRPLMDN